MIVASHNKRVLRECFDSLDSYSREEYKFFKAICRSLDYDEVRSFYGIYVPNEKVTTKIDSVSTEGLQLKYPLMEHAVIKKVMDQQKTWTSSCDVLSSLVSSHGTVFIDSLEFSIDNYDWPSVEQSIRKCKNEIHAVSNELDWTIFELDALEFSDRNPNSPERLSIDAKVAKRKDDAEFQGSNPLHEHSISQVREDENENSGDWEIVDHYGLEVTNFEEHIENSTDRHRSSYRDVLLRSAGTQDEKVKRIVTKKLSEPADWRPIFHVVKTGRKRVDRIYGNRDTAPRLQSEDYNEKWIDETFSSQPEMYDRAAIDE